METNTRPRARVAIREVRPSDEAEYLERVRASRRLHRPWAYLADTPDAFRELLIRAAAPTDAVFLICRLEDGAIAGIASLGQIFLGNFRNAYLGYSAFAPFEGQGYMTEGLRLVLREAFGPIDLHRVEANIQPENVRSIALAERVGFRREGFSPRYLKIGGRWKDHVRYAILAEDFLALEAERRSGQRG
jgi:[ribosomal protein S5]-alanine N-acetyltransferase